MGHIDKRGSSIGRPFLYVIVLLHYKLDSSTKTKILFWNILDRQANFGRASRDLGPGGIKGGPPRKEKKYAAPFKKYRAATQ